MTGWHATGRLFEVFARLVFAGIVFIAAVHAEEVKLPMTEVRAIHSAIVGDDYRISVALPQGGAGRRYPVIYLLDANGLFGTLAETARLLAGGGDIPPSIVVGVGYPVPTMADTVAQRSRDFTPTRDAAHEELLQVLLHRDDRVVTGGGPRFLRFIREELQPYVARNFPVDPGDSTLVGNSLGGLFGLYVLLEQPGTFKRYVIGSPPVLWDRGVLMRSEARYAMAHKDLPVHLYMVIGSLEADLSRVLRLPPEMHDAERAFLSKIGNPDGVVLFGDFVRKLQSRGYPGLRLHTEVLQGESHDSLPPIQMSRGMRSVHDNLH